jgi:hypothetical protein
MLAAAVGAVVYGTYNIALPSVADTRGLPGNVEDVDKAEKAATWGSVVAVSAISLLAKSPEVFIIGGLFTIGLSWTYKHSSKVDNFQSQARELITPDKSSTPSGLSMAPKLESVSLNTGTGGSAF